MHSSNPPTDDVAVICELLASHLQTDQPTSLYQLIKWLQQPQQAIFNADALQDSLLLFRCNFLLMHCLYRLKIQWLSDGSGELDISALAIVRRPFSATTHCDTGSEPDGQLCAADPLQAYYLDLDNLATSREQVEQLLNQFWKKMTRPDYAMHQNQDLATLELQPPVSAQQIRQQYRRLAMQHHPDRGGDSVKFRQISAAFQRLKHTNLYQ